MADFSLHELPSVLNDVIEKDPSLFAPGIDIITFPKGFPEPKSIEELTKPPDTKQIFS